jgi:site-specific recombinase XerC
MYGSGLRLHAGAHAAVKDVDFQRGMILVRQGKGGKDRQRNESTVSGIACELSQRLG